MRDIFACKWPGRKDCLPLRTRLLISSSRNLPIRPAGCHYQLESRFYVVAGRRYSSTIMLIIVCFWALSGIRKSVNFSSMCSVTFKVQQFWTLEKSGLIYVTMMVVNYFNRVALSVISIKTLNPSISFGYFFACSHVMAYIYVMSGGRRHALDMRTPI